MDKYPDIKQEGRDTGLDGNHDYAKFKFGPAKSFTKYDVEMGEFKWSDEI